MSTRILVRACSAMVVVFLAAPAVFAQILNPRITISGGGSIVKADRTFTAGGETFNTEFANGGRAKARLTLDLTKHFSVEGVYGFGTSNLRVNELGGNPKQQAFGVREHEVQFNILHFFTGSGSHVRPFLTTGVGAARFGPTDAAKTSAAVDEFINAPAQISASNKISLAIGGGIEGRFSRWLGLRVDLRDHISAVPTFGLPQTAPTAGAAFFPVSGIVHNIHAEAGIVFYLWR